MQLEMVSCTVHWEVRIQLYNYNYKKIKKEITRLTRC